MAHVMAAVGAGKEVFEVVGSAFSSPGWKNKKRPMILLFANTSKTPVKISNWKFISGKALEQPSTEPFKTNFKKAYLCEGDSTVFTGACASFTVTVGKASVSIYVENPYSGCSKISFGKNHDEAYKKANDGNPKDTKVGPLKIYMKKQRVDKMGNSAGIGFLIRFV